MKNWKPPVENLPNIIEKIVEGSFFPHFFHLINLTEYADRLTEMPATVFVPVEDTVDIISAEQFQIIEKALKDKKLALEIVENHIIEEPVSLSEMVNLKEIKTINGKPLKVDVQCRIREDYEFSIENACSVKAEINGLPMETANIVCYNGFIHTIRGVII
ncbi:fasciclin domain-containing protein [Persephonella sp.]